ncbi:catalase-like [Bicyclus anynana]|uniref:Catalase-like n=1 Tax=Bicyclus anynana TaxID=110368 RepID=A0ABM3LHN3_BICAN|nr:catalase-like [Bicyclus anynana]
MNNRDEAFVNFQGPVGVLTTSAGAPVPYTDATNTLNAQLIYNTFFMDSITSVNRERIPERVNHGKGAGAFGYFQVTRNVSHIFKADFLKKVGTKTPVAVRFSQALSDRGSPEVTREGRGFAVKFYTKEGNFDLPGNSIPVYFYKDPIYFNRFLHALKRNPATNLIDPHTLWDLITLAPETLNNFLRVFSDAGIPTSYRNMPGYPIHTHQVENKNGECNFVRFHFLPDGGIKYLMSEEARNLNVMDPDYMTRDLYRAIGNGDFPSWTLHIQILSEADVKKAGPKVFDVTRIIPLKEHPLHEVGKLVLDRNPKNYFAEVEQLAFSPSNLVPGMLGSPDKIYEGRKLAYRDTQCYRLGKNFNKMTVNCPFRVRTFTYNRDGVSPVRDNEEDIPNYYPNSFHGPVPYMTKPRSSLIKIIETQPDNFDQIQEFVNELKTDEKSRLIENLVYSLQTVFEPLQRKAVDIFTSINVDLGNGVANGLNMTKCY